MKRYRIFAPLLALLLSLAACRPETGVNSPSASSSPLGAASQGEQQAPEAAGAPEGQEPPRITKISQLLELLD